MTVWEKFKDKVKVTVDEAGVEIEKQRRIYSVRKEIAQHETAAREIEANVARLQESRARELQNAGEIAYRLQKEGELGDKWQQVAGALEGIPELEVKIGEEQGGIEAARQESERLRQQIESIREEYRRKRELVHEEAAARAKAEEDRRPQTTGGGGGPATTDG